MTKEELMKITNRLLVKCNIKTILNLYKKCNENNIELLIYKGIALSVLLYNDVYTRRRGDIDCIIRKEDIKLFLKILREEGFTDKTNREIYPDFFEQYIARQHLLPFIKIDGEIITQVEVHINTLSNPERFLPCIDLFQNKQEIIINEKNKIYTLSHTLNFISLINHYIQHDYSLVYSFPTSRREDKIVQNLKLLYEINKFYIKYSDFIDLKLIVDISNTDDLIEFLELFNHHYNELFGVELFSKNDLMNRRNTNQYYQKQLCKFLLDIPLNELRNYSFNDLSDKFQNTFMHDPCKIVNLYENQVFSEKICMNNSLYLLASTFYPAYSVAYQGKNLFFNISFNEKYFVLKYVNIIIAIEKNHKYFIHSIHFTKDMENIIIEDFENKNISHLITVKLIHSEYTINVKLENIDFNILRYNIIVSNQDLFCDCNSPNFLVNHFSLTNTIQLLDPTKYCELHLLGSDV